MAVVEIDTVIGEDASMDAIFYEYLAQNEITFNIISEEEQAWPTVQYTGSALALKEMLIEKFGLNLEDIKTLYSDLL